MTKIYNKITAFFGILTLIIYIFRALYKNELKKQKSFEKNKKPVNSKTKSDILRELEKTLHLPEGRLQDFSGESEQNSEEQNQNRNTQKTKKPKPSSDNTVHTKMKYEKLAYTSLKHELKRKNKDLATKKYKFKKMEPVAEIFEMDNNTTAYHDFKIEDFDPKTAVIYSEILKRPQY